MTANYIEYLDIVDWTGTPDAPVADLAGLLKDLGDHVLWHRSVEGPDGRPAFEVAFNHRTLRNTVAHGRACARGFVGCVKFEVPE